MEQITVRLASTGWTREATEADAELAIEAAAETAVMLGVEPRLRAAAKWMEVALVWTGMEGS